MVTITSIIVHVILCRAVPYLCCCVNDILLSNKGCIDNDKSGDICILTCGIYCQYLYHTSITYKIISHGLIVINHLKNCHWYCCIWNILQKTNKFSHWSQWIIIFIRTRKILTKVIKTLKIIKQITLRTITLWWGLEDKIDQILSAYKWYRYIWGI